MYRIVMNALWSRDYLLSLKSLLKSALDIDEAEARNIISGLVAGKSKEIICSSPGTAYDLSSELVQLGVFTEAEQIGSITTDIIGQDIADLLHEDLSMFEVVCDDQDRVVRLLESHTLGFLKFENQEITDMVGKEVLLRGGKRAGQERMEEVLRITEALREERISYAKEMTALYGHDWKNVLWERRIHPHSPAMEEE